MVVSTCSVTADAASSSRQAVRRAAREHPGARIVVAGCHVEQEGELLAALPGVAAVVGPRDHRAIPGLLLALRDGADAGAALALARKDAPGWDGAPAAGAGHARPVLKVQDGCDDACAYCVVPSARGGSRSLPLDECLARLASLGASRAEVVLSGVHLGGWGRDLSPRLSLADLLRAAASGADRPAHPALLRRAAGVPGRVLAEEAGAILCEHFHLPLQSGSDRLLAAMGRPYRAAGYARVVEGVVRAAPAPPSAPT